MLLQTIEASKRRGRVGLSSEVPCEMLEHGMVVVENLPSLGGCVAPIDVLIPAQIIAENPRQTNR